ncbi:hypothetical protein BHE90_012288 [Fusarium euwallaceae]|uniref:Uncharacterized protein n=1 Tax=Fusarium euwallaceae TaxID=1147111 RepID=A0A430LC04_9HYPO|nr:hypothetical protein BHE90_012288 [Fusarium euwallaceae]
MATLESGVSQNSSLPGYCSGVTEQNNTLDQGYSHMPTTEGRTDKYRRLDTELSPRVNTGISYPDRHGIRPPGFPLFAVEQGKSPFEWHIPNSWSKTRVAQWLDDVPERFTESAPIRKPQRLPVILETALARHEMDIDKDSQLPGDANGIETDGSGQLSRSVDKMEIDEASQQCQSWEAMDVDQVSHVSSTREISKFVSWVSDVNVDTANRSIWSVRPSSDTSTWERIGSDVQEDVEMTDWCYSCIGGELCLFSGYHLGGYYKASKPEPEPNSNSKPSPISHSQSGIAGTPPALLGSWRSLQVSSHYQEGLAQWNFTPGSQASLQWLNYPGRGVKRYSVSHSDEDPSLVLLASASGTITACRFQFQYQPVY